MPKRSVAGLFFARRVLLPDNRPNDIPMTTRLLAAITCLLLLAPLRPLAQHTTHRCYTTQAVEIREQQHPGYQAAVDQAFRSAKRHAEQGMRNDEVYLIPVVVHVVYNNPDHNIADSVVLSQIDVLNEDFRRWNLDAEQTREEFLPVAADAGIQFVLATEDPDGNPTTGITRRQTTRTSWLGFPEFLPNDIKRSAQGGVDAWDTERYLNIWVGDLSLGGLPFILGFAYPPAELDNWPANSNAPDPGLEGVVVHNAVFGRNNPLTTDLLATNGLGRTCTHEVGHFLGLRHTWGDGGGFFGPDGCSVDDGIDDTPNCADSQGQECSYSANTCVDEPIDLPDQIENYMDYSDERCQNMFSRGQADLMRAVLETSRSSLVTTLPASVADMGRTPDVRLFPNPTDGMVTLNWDRAANVSITVSDALGRAVHAQSVTATDRAEIDLGGLSSGIYTVLLHSSDWQRASRLVVR